jgi:hypothetical protein
MTVISRILGLVRDIVFARLLGASIGADTFIVAFKIPNRCIQDPQFPASAVCGGCVFSSIRTRTLRVQDMPEPY